MRPCSNKQCKQNNPQLITEFYKDDSHKDGLSSSCKSCIKSKVDRYRKASPEKIRVSKRKYREENREKETFRIREWQKRNHKKFLATQRKYRYGVGQKEIDNLLALQLGKCGICKEDFIREPNLDHNHKTKKVRGLLCRKCNHGLGNFDDNPKILLSALAYVRKHDDLLTWDLYFLSLAEVVAMKSKDPRTKVGAILAKDNRVISSGYNGFGIGIKDTYERWQTPEKYQRVVHAERNAVSICAQYGIATRGTILYVTLPPCNECAKSIIQCGIIEVVIGNPAPPHWSSVEDAISMLEEAKVKVRFAF